MGKQNESRPVRGRWEVHTMDSTVIVSHVTNEGVECELCVSRSQATSGGRRLLALLEKADSASEKASAVLLTDTEGEKTLAVTVHRHEAVYRCQEDAFKLSLRGLRHSQSFGERLLAAGQGESAHA